MKTQARPNVIFILTDDQRADTLGCMGNNIVNTPNIDRLARDGMMFLNASVTCAICTPSRACFFTGLYERQHGVNFNSGTGLSAASWYQTYPMVLGRAGYFTGYIGKNHVPVGPRGYATHTMDESFDYWYASHKHLLFYPKKKPYPMCATWGYDNKMFNNAKANTQVEIIDEGTMNFFKPQPNFYEKAVRFLKKRKKGEPFCLSICFNLPHDAGTGNMWLLPSDDALYRTAYRDKKAQIEAQLPKTYCAKADIKTPKLPPEILHAKYRQGGYNYVNKKKDMVERLIRRYQTIEGIDRFVGHVRSTLNELKLAKNTVIILTSDHGIMRGEFGLGGKALNYEPCLRVPMIIYHPQFAAKTKKHVSSKLVQSIDVAPTILDIAGVPVPERMKGKSMLRILRGENVPWRKHTFAENLWSNCFGNPRIESVRREDGWKYIRYFKNDINRHDRSLRGKARAAVSHAEARQYRLDLSASIRGEKPVYEELFNLNTDPDETTNLVGDPKHQEVLADCRMLCEQSVKDAYGDGPIQVDQLLGERREVYLAKKKEKAKQ